MRWIEIKDGERIKIAIGGLVQGEGEKVDGGNESLVKVFEEIYKKNVTDEFLSSLMETREGLKVSLVGFLMLRQLNVMCISLFRQRYHILL